MTYNIDFIILPAVRSEIWQDINSGQCGSATIAVMVEGKVVYAEGTYIELAGFVNDIFTVKARLRSADEKK